MRRHVPLISLYVQAAKLFRIKKSNIIIHLSMNILDLEPLPVLLNNMLNSKTNAKQ